MKYVLMAALLTVSTTGFAADPQMEEMLSLIRAQQEHIEALQQQLNDTRESLQSLSNQVQENALASETANEPARMGISPTNVKTVTPTTADTTCPPTRFRG